MRLKKISILITVLLLLGVVWGGVSYFGASDIRTESSRGIVDLPATGEIASLSRVMRDDRELADRVRSLLAYDAQNLFQNHAQVNAQIVEVLFRWSGLSSSALDNISGARGVEFFLRQHYALPEEEPVFNSPYLGARPWPRLFQRYQSRLLMQGGAASVFDGDAYYDPQADRFMVSGQVSRSFVKGFATFAQGLPMDQRRKMTQNFLVFIDEVVGIKNLSDADNDTLAILYQLMQS